MGLAHATTPVISPQSIRLRRARARGFTLIELVAVVVIIAIVAALAIPSLAGRMRDRRTRQAAQTIAQLYATARMRAMGRGAAVLVRYDGTRFTMLEAIRGTADEADPNCQPLPIASCLNGGAARWVAGAPGNRQVAEFAPLNRSVYANLSVALERADNGDEANSMDVCFTPLGSAFVAYDGGGNLSRLAGIPVARVSRTGVVGLTRTVMVLPNGNAQLGTAQ
jgi:type IV fimbrial biogenesis protein FimT